MGKVGEQDHNSPNNKDSAKSEIELVNWEHRIIRWKR